MVKKFVSYLPFFFAGNKGWLSIENFSVENGSPLLVKEIDDEPRDQKQIFLEEKRDISRQSENIISQESPFLIQIGR